MTNCVFCSIIAGEQAASLVYQDELCLAFLDIHPINPGHTLVVPRGHAPGLAELPEEAAEAMILAAQKVAAALYASNMKCSGVNLWLADGASAGQDVFHVHLHVLPRFDGDGFGFKLPEHYHLRPEREQLDRFAADLHVALDNR